MAHRRMYNMKFVFLLFFLWFMTMVSAILFYISLFPIFKGDFGALEIFILPIFLFCAFLVGGAVYILSRSYLIMFDRGDHYVLFGSFPRLTRKLELNKHFQITRKEYFYDNTGKEETLYRHLIITNGLKTQRILLLPKKWIYLIEKKRGHIRKWRVGLGEEMEYPPAL